MKTYDELESLIVEKTAELAKVQNDLKFLIQARKGEVPTVHQPSKAPTDETLNKVMAILGGQQ